MLLRVIESGPGGAAFNMALDEAIAQRVRAGESPFTLRLYSWEGASLSIGSFQKLNGINLEAVKSKKVPVVKRPTGGRAILHGEELTYSFSSRYEGSFRGGLFACCEVISRAIYEALKETGVPVQVKSGRGKDRVRSAVCFQSVSFAEITAHGKKLVGSAQKRWTDGFLQQGSIPYRIDRGLSSAIFPDFDPGLMTGLEEASGGDFYPERFVQAMREEFAECLGAALRVEGPCPAELALARELLPKYLFPL